MKSLYLYLGYTTVIFLLIKVYSHIQYDRQRKAGSLLKWVFGFYALLSLFPIVSTPNTDKEQRLKRFANISLVLFYLFFALTLITVYVSVV
jgi:hypothetical protein